MNIQLSSIIPDPNQPRKTFKEETLKELQASYNSLGLIQPLTVRPRSNDKYMIITGERRYRAALLDGLDTVECVVREDVDDRKAREMQFTENSQQEDVPPLELGRAFLEHRKQYGLTQEMLAASIGISRQKIGDCEALLSATNSVQSYLQSGQLDASTAYEISTIKDEKRQAELADFAVKQELTRSQVRQIKPIVESQKHRTVGQIYKTMDDEKKAAIPDVLPPKIDTHDIDLPISLIELKLTLEKATILSKHLELPILDLLSSQQKQDLVMTGENCIRAIHSLIGHIRTGSQNLIEG